MIPGTILFHDNFIYSDGSKGEKLLVVLNDGSNGEYFVVKMTSNPARYSSVFGCHLQVRFPHFYMPSAACCLKKDSWIQLEEVFRFERQATMNNVMRNVIKRIGLIGSELTMDLIQCISKSEDIEERIIENILAECSCLNPQNA